MRPVNDEMLRRFLDGELSPAEERAALHEIADDADARALLRFEARLRDEFGGAVGRGEAVPPGFTERVMGAIEAREARRAGAWSRLWERFTRPRTVVWRPAYAAAAVAAVALLIALVVGPLANGPAPRAEGTVVADRGGETGAMTGTSAVGAAGAERVLVRFVFADGAAESVAVAGDFSRWEPIPLHRRDANGESVWTGTVAVPRGEHRYMFVLDGERWVTDPLATAARDDGFGNRNAILSL